jgi:hypothetical protein
VLLHCIKNKNVDDQLILVPKEHSIKKQKLSINNLRKVHFVLSYVYKFDNVLVIDVVQYQLYSLVQLNHELIV